MIFQRLIWAALATALVVGSVQTGVQRLQVAPLILAAEAFEEQKTVSHEAEPAHTHTHSHGAEEAWQPQSSAERIGWTWVANILHAFSMALLLFAVMGVWLYRRGTASTPWGLAAWVAAAGWLCLHFWPALGMPADIPGVEVAPLRDRQVWWLLAVSGAAAACAVAGFARTAWRWPVVVALLALPFAVGAPQVQGDPLAGFGPQAHADMERLGTQFVWATTLVSISFWVSMGAIGGWAFQRWLRPAVSAMLDRVRTASVDTHRVAP